MSAATWEDLILEWLHTRTNQYARVEKHAGSGDMGLDVVAFEDSTADDPWDNYQCKHYDHPLAPTDIWVELGKLAHYTFSNEFSLPRRYFFVAPQGVGNTLSKLIRSPTNLRDDLFEAWPKYCQRKITSTREIPLDAPMRKHIEDMNFDIFKAVSPLTVIEEHAKTRWHIYRFGGGLPERHDSPTPPPNLMSNETTYVRALLDAYESHLGVKVNRPGDLRQNENLEEHFVRSRREFYSAESLRAFSRDNVPPGTFESLLDEIQDGVLDEEQASHGDGYARVLAVVRQAKLLQLTSNALITRTRTTDRGGMCHQLANEHRLRWRR